LPSTSFSSALHGGELGAGFGEGGEVGAGFGEGGEVGAGFGVGGKVGAGFGEGGEVGAGFGAGFGVGGEVGAGFGVGGEFGAGSGSVASELVVLAAGVEVEVGSRKDVSVVALAVSASPPVASTSDGPPASLAEAQRSAIITVSVVEESSCASWVTKELRPISTELLIE